MNAILILTSTKSFCKSYPLLLPVLEARYLLTLTDDVNWSSWIYFLKEKGETLTKLKDLSPGSNAKQTTRLNVFGLTTAENMITRRPKTT